MLHRFDWIYRNVLAILFLTGAISFADDQITPSELSRIRAIENTRIETINKVIGSVIAIYGEERQGGGSGVIIDPTGIALTNHHVIMGAGTKGWGGLADGELYRWELIGTDPGGDVSIIQMKGKDNFPFTPLANSDLVQAGDWALAMGNPFVLTEDQAPTVTLGIVSGVKRYQYGATANQLVYGNCIQTDSSINPGNSGGPLFNLAAEVIGINGRGSFKERGRVNVGLGYAISSNQIKNFIPELLATKLVEHGTLDANFEDRSGKVVCSNLFEDSELYKQGVRPGDELLRFEGVEVESANQFTNLICTLPEDWPAELVIRNKNEKKLVYHVRLYGLPYEKPEPVKVPGNEKDQTPEQKEQIKRRLEMVDLLSAQPGTIRKQEINQQYAGQILKKWKNRQDAQANQDSSGKLQSWSLKDQILKEGTQVGSQELLLFETGEFYAKRQLGGESSEFVFRQGMFYEMTNEGQHELSLVDLKLSPLAIQAVGIAASNQFFNMDQFGSISLDGSGKAQRQNAYRMKWLDEDNDSFYVWLSMQNDDNKDEVRLLKTGADMDCQHDYGGIIFSEWDEIQGISIPKVRTQIRGLSENEILTFKNQSVEQKLLNRDEFFKTIAVESK